MIDAATPSLGFAASASPPARSLAPGRPQQARELLAVPGAPHAQDNRPAQAPGRIPVGADAQADDARSIEQRIEHEKRASLEYQLIRRMLKNEGDEAPAEAPEPEQAPPPVADATLREAPPVPAERPRPESPAPGTGAAQPAAPAAETVERKDPLALDLDGDGLHTTGVGAGVAFDIDGDGRMDRVSFVSGGDAFLALDRNGNGRIDDGRELFGDHGGHANGFESLAALDDNGDGRIDGADRLFSQLRTLRADERGGLVEASLADAGVRAIELSYTDVDIALNAYDRVAQIARFERDDGSTGATGDLLLGFRTLA